MTDKNQPPAFIQGKDLPEGFEPEQINTATYKGWQYSWSSDHKGYFRGRPMQTKYFLLANDEVAEIMVDEGFEELVKRLQNEGDDEYLFYDLHEFKPDNAEEPEQTLYKLTVNELADYFLISKEEYQTLLNL